MAGGLFGTTRHFPTGAIRSFIKKARRLVAPGFLIDNNLVSIDFFRSSSPFIQQADQLSGDFLPSL